MILYRSIGQSELTALLLDGHVHGRYDNSVEKQNDSTLKKVCCFFTEALRWLDGCHDFFIEVDIPNDRIIGKGVGVYYAPKNLKQTYVWTGRRGSVEYHFDEVYINEYSLSDIKTIRGLHKFTDNHINTEIKPILDKFNIEII